ncbi:GDP-perosamine synthase [Amorphoplanes nipponensis]|uniref:GDP-perosamine synthase n=1 Tax=Actinoplanes nipponensis TaxID=135950 RepID=A0A919JCX9_9ACTN|nr:DegT/DnrJ/EryC1/StrS family aminotransferase [Actinoplanes nipponensis]GIE47070.1 GDP-perosamine synthase [Actinoplanes nipponensis]
MTASGTTTGGALALDGGTPVIEPAHRFQWPRISDDERAAVTALLERGELSYYGREGVLTELEEFWSGRLSGRRTLGLSSGTAALHSAYFALGAGPGDEVLCPTNTFLATVMPLVQLGAVPVLCDAEADTGNIDPAAIAAAITPRTVGITVTHLWGHPCEMDAILQIARRHGLWVVEDCSHAHGASYHGREVGTLGDAAAFSFQAAKIVYAGQGGLLASRETEVHERACLLGHFRVRSEQDVAGPLKRYASTGFGLNYRMHPFAAGLALQSSRVMDQRIAARAELLGRLADGLATIPGLVPPVTREGCDRGAYYGFKLRLTGPWLAAGADLVARALGAEGLDVHPPGSRPLHLLPFFADGAVPVRRNASPQQYPAYKEGDFPVAEEVWRTSLSLPTFTFADEAGLVDRYCEAFEKVAGQLPALTERGVRQ